MILEVSSPDVPRYLTRELSMCSLSRALAGHAHQSCRRRVQFEAPPLSAPALRAVIVDGCVPDFVRVVVETDHRLSVADAAAAYTRSQRHGVEVRFPFPGAHPPLAIGEHRGVVLYVGFGDRAVPL